MHVRLNPTDLVDEDFGRFDASAAQVVVDDLLDLGREQRPALLGMPGEVQVNLGVEVPGHRAMPPPVKGTRLKPNGEKPRERGSAAIIGSGVPAVNGGPITAARKAP